MQNYRLTLAYDGTRYRGWQRLPPPAKTVQASVETALGEIFGQPLEISGSGRTDAGVHAACQVASFHAPKRPTDEVLAQLRRLLPEDIGALTLDYAPERFHARLSAVEKTYVYRLWNSDRPDVFARRYRAWEPRQLDCGAMRAGAAGLVGTHDFFTFCANRQMKKSTVRTLRRLDITQEDAELRFTLTADGFLYHMARILVGTLWRSALAGARQRACPHCSTPAAVRWQGRRPRQRACGSWRCDIEHSDLRPLEVL